MLEGKPRESLVLYDTPIEIAAGVDPNDPFKKNFGCKLSRNTITSAARLVTLIYLNFTPNLISTFCLFVQRHVALELCHQWMQATSPRARKC